MQPKVASGSRVRASLKLLHCRLHDEIHGVHPGLAAVLRGFLLRLQLPAKPIVAAKHQNDRQAQCPKKPKLGTRH